MQELSCAPTPRARGSARLTAAADAARGTNIASLRQLGSLKLLFPRRRAHSLDVVAVNTAGGVTGGDAYDLSLHARPGAAMTFATQAAERIYRAGPGRAARIENRISLAAGARVNWLPQETILYRGCALERSLSVEMAATSALLLVEPMIFGRAAMGETLTDVHYRDRIEIRREGEPVFLDALSLRGDLAAHLRRPAVAEGAGAMASLVYAAPDAAGWLPAVRDRLPAGGGASLLRDDILFARLLAADGFELRKSLIPILNDLTGNALPRTWML